MSYGLQIGRCFIPDILNPRPEQMDIREISLRLRHMRRWSNDPKALTVFQHVQLVGNIASLVFQHRPEEHSDVMFWCLHHDDHEAIIGEIPGPLKHLIRDYSGILETVEHGLDDAICQALGHHYPNAGVRKAVHAYDKMSETIEWRYVLKQPPAPWNYPLPPELDESRCRRMLNAVTPPARVAAFSSDTKLGTIGGPE